MIVDNADFQHLPDNLVAAIGAWAVSAPQVGQALAVEFDDDTLVPTRGWYGVFADDGTPVMSDSLTLDRVDRPIHGAPPFPYGDWLRNEMAQVPERRAVHDAAEAEAAEARIEAAKVDGVTLDDLIENAGA